jgi:putative transposase
MIRAYLFAMDPTDTQIEALRSHCGARRVAYNWALARGRARTGRSAPPSRPTA